MELLRSWYTRWYTFATTRKSKAAGCAVFVGTFVVLCSIASMIAGTIGIVGETVGILPTATSKPLPTATTAPTAILLPTATPVPTIAPTSTPSPTEAPELTSATEPTDVPVAVTSSTGLGISRSAFVASFESAGVTFENSPLRDGRERMLGTSTNKVVTIEIIGPASNVTEASVLAPASSDETTNTLTILHMAQILKVGAPEWEGGLDWLTTSITELGQERRAGTEEGMRTETIGQKRVRLGTLDLSGTVIFILAIESL